jgi:hypothetical protein
MFMQMRGSLNASLVQHGLAENRLLQCKAAHIDNGVNLYVLS